MTLEQLIDDCFFEDNLIYFSIEFSEEEKFYIRIVPSTHQNDNLNPNVVDGSIIMRDIETLMQ